jgi:predicted nucleic acid-binding protein
MAVLLDTDVLSALRRPERNPHLAKWLTGQDAEEFYISAVTEMEIVAGVLAKERQDPAQGLVLRLWLESVQKLFQGRVLPFDSSTARVAAAIAVLRTRGLADTQIAATAIAHSMPLATRNTKDFADIPGLALVDPWAK